MADIEMTTDDTLELDTIIKESNDATTPITVTKGSDYNLSGFQTHTGVFDPQSAGDYTLNINGQQISISVTDTGYIPDSVLLDDYTDNKFASNRDTYGQTQWNKNKSDYTVPSTSTGNIQASDTRPNWDGDTGNVSVSNGELTFKNPNTGIYTTDYSVSFGYFRFAISLAGNSDDDFIGSILAKNAADIDGAGANYGTSNNGYHIRVGQSNILLIKRSGGSSSTIGSTSWSHDSNLHFFDVKWKNNGDFEVYLDGTQQFKASDSTYGSGDINSDSGYGISNNASSSDMNVDRFEVY